MLSYFRNYENVNVLGNELEQRLGNKDRSKKRQAESRDRLRHFDVSRLAPRSHFLSINYSILSPPRKKVHDLLEINQETIELIKKKEGGATTKVINLIKSIEKKAEEESNDPFLIAMAERAKAVQEKFEDRQSTTAEVLDELLKLVENNERRKKEQAEKGFDGLTYFVYRTMLDAGVSSPEEVSKKIKTAFTEHPSWKQREKELRELRNKVTFAIFAQEDDLNKVTAMVDELFTLLGKASSI